MGKALSGSSVENNTSKVDGDPAGKDWIWVWKSVNLLRS
jgi:hypothetical protein